MNETSRFRLHIPDMPEPPVCATLFKKVSRCDLYWPVHGVGKDAPSAWLAAGNEKWACTISHWSPRFSRTNVIRSGRVIFCPPAFKSRTASVAAHATEPAAEIDIHP